MRLGLTVRHGDFVEFDNSDNSTSLGRVREIFDDHSTGLNNPEVKKFGIERLLQYDELPRELQTPDRLQRAETSNERWLDEQVILNVNVNRVRTIAHGFMDDNTEDEYIDHGHGEFIIREIVYRPRGSIEASARRVADRHVLSAELYQPCPPPDPSIKVLKIFLDVYWDDFGPFRSVYHALGGVYVIFGNMPLKLRQKIKHNHLLGFVPFGVSFQAFIAPVAEELQKLQKGVLMEIDGKECWIVVGTYCYH